MKSSRLVFWAVAGLVVVAGAATRVAASDQPPSQPSVHAAPTVLTPNGAWTVYHHDNGHTGYDSTIAPASSAKAGWTSATLDDTIYGSPLIYQGIVYVGTLNNTVYALNQTDGSVVWFVHLRAPETSGWQCGNISHLGILGTPVIDIATGRIYVTTFGSDDLYRLEGLNLATGVEELNTVITTMLATGFDWTIQQERGALAVANGYVYVPFGGRWGDCGTYHGWVFAVPTNGAAVTHWYATPGSGAGFWAAGGVVVDNSTGNVFETSGNGTSSGCNANGNGTPTYENDAVVALSPTLAHLNAFIPQDWQNNWCTNDQDLGSASMVLISPTLAFQAGKWGNGFLVNPQNLGGMDGQLYPTPKPAPYSSVDVCLGNHNDANFGSYAYAAPYVYLSCEGNGMVALSVDTTANTFSNCDVTCAGPSWNTGGVGTMGPPIVAGGFVWAVDAGGSGGLYGFDAATGAVVYHSAGFSANRFTSPSEAGGQVFVSAGSEVRQFVMTYCLTASLSPGSTSQAAGTTVNLTASSTGCANPRYEFWVQYPDGTWNLKQGFGGSAFAWDTTGLPPGTYTVHAWVNTHGTTYDAIGSSTVVLTGCMSGSLSPLTVTQAAGSTVNLTAGSSNCPNPRYEFWVQDASGTWTMKQIFGGATFAWDTTGLPPGNFIVHVWVNNQGTGHDTIGSSTVTLTGCTSASVAPPTVSQPAGSTVNLTASSGGCANPTYEFWIRDPNGTWNLARGFGGPTFGWVTTGLAAGTYTVHAWANQTGAAPTLEVYGASMVTLTNCVSAAVSPPSSSAEAGSTVNLTASSSGCFSPRYEFWVQYPGGSWNLKQGFGGPGFPWDTTNLAPGTYTIHAWVNSSGTGHEAIGSATVMLTGCTSASVAPPSTSAAAGTTVNLTASSGGCTNPTYEFWVQDPNGTWNLKRGFGAPTFAWDTSGLRPGMYTVHAWANQTGAAPTLEVYGTSMVTLTGCTSSSVVPPSGSAPVGTMVTFTASSSGCPTPVYEFWVQYPDGTWHLGRAFSTVTSWTWDSAGRAKGNYVIHVWANNQGADTSLYETIGSATYTLT